MAGEVVAKEFYAAALKGDVIKSLQLLKKHPYLVDGVSFPFSRNLLHIATLRGEAGIVEEVLKINRELARNLDSQRSSPLHIAAAEGNLEIAQKLLAKAPEMLWCRNGQGMNPVHVAAMSGKKDVLEELIRDDYLPAMERLRHGQTVLHLCVKHRELEVLKVLVEKLGELYVEARDKYGDTILDSAVRSNQVDMIRYLVHDTKINKRTMNSMKNRALKILKRSPPNPTTGSKIRKLLRIHFALVSSEEMRRRSSALMVVAVLIATMAFQAAASPPGGVWQDEDDDTSSYLYKAGNSVMAFTHPKAYRVFLVANTGAFLLSLITILMLISGLPSKRVSVGLLVSYTVILAEVSIIVSYAASLIVITPNMDILFLHLVGGISMIMSAAYMLFFFILDLL